MRTHLSYLYNPDNSSNFIDVTWIKRFFLIIKRLQNYPPLIPYRFNINSKVSVQLSLEVMKPERRHHYDVF